VSDKTITSFFFSFLQNKNGNTMPKSKLFAQTGWRAEKEALLMHRRVLSITIILNGEIGLLRTLYSSSIT